MAWVHNSNSNSINNYKTILSTKRRKRENYKTAANFSHGMDHTHVFILSHRIDLILVRPTSCQRLDTSRGHIG